MSTNRALMGATIALAALSVACRQDMHDQPKYVPLRPSAFFGDGRSSRPTVEGSVARGELREDTAFFTGKGRDGKLVDAFPFPVTRQVMERGQSRFNIYCTPCHGRLGDGSGMIVQRGFRRPPAYTIQRLIDAPVGHFFDVITNGIGDMQDYAAQVEPRDRWAIAAYVRALQLSGAGRIAEAPDAAQAQLSNAAGGSK